MKLSEMTGEVRADRLKYVDERWKQLHEQTKEKAESAWNYLMLTNSGSAVALLSFMGAYKKIDPIPGAPAMLTLFLLGIILVGIGRAATYYRTFWLFSHWQHEVSRLFNDERDWETTIDSDNSRSKGGYWIDLIGITSFACFCGGLAIGMINANHLG